jgi:hypothetical protein
MSNNHRIRHRFLALVSVLASVVPAAVAQQMAWPMPYEWQPPATGIVANAETAVRIALAVLPNLGAEARREVSAYQPWRATAIGDAWQVRGTLPPGWAGGTSSS